MIKVKLKGSEKEFESGVSVAEVAKSIGMGLYKSACAAKVNGEVCDLRTVLNDCLLYTSHSWKSKTSEYKAKK